MLLTVEPASESVSRDQPIVIGLVNNMPDGAIRTTERQFRDLLSAASEARVVHLRAFSLPGLPRSEAAQTYINRHYENFNELWADHLDGLIVTGTEPRASTLTEEPYWGALTKLIDWSAAHTFSAVWSCLAAHAAVLHLDGVERRRLPRKLSGVFTSVKTGDHEIIAGVPPRWSTPHSRLNDLPEEWLAARGYQVLFRSAEAGADLFIRDRGSLDIFFQSHPEYEPNTLLHEYRRDVRRYLTGEQNSYPEMPCGYFDDDAATAMISLRPQTRDERDVNPSADFPMADVGRKCTCAWREPAVRLYTNWISYLAECKSSPARKKGNGHEHRPFA